LSDRPTVFVVDDDQAVRKGLAGSLKERGYSVATYPSAVSFLESIETDQPGCLVLDVRMPTVSGLELQDQLTALGFRIPIIFITGHGDIPMTVRAMKKGAVDFLEKPYRLDLLVERIEEALEQDAETRRVEAIGRDVNSRFERLTAREREVMGLLVRTTDNTTSREIADTLGISHRTVETHRARIMEKMRATSLPDLISMATICGIRQSST
jgi:RNA polymerase sigma factor (sigma-70 family)